MAAIIPNLQQDIIPADGETWLSVPDILKGIWHCCEELNCRCPANCEDSNRFFLDDKTFVCPDLSRDEFGCYVTIEDFGSVPLDNVSDGNTFRHDYVFQVHHRNRAAAIAMGLVFDKKILAQAKGLNMACGRLICTRLSNARDFGTSLGKYMYRRQLQSTCWIPKCQGATLCE